MAGVFLAAPGAHEAFSAGHKAWSAHLASVGAADSEAMLNAAGTALGPIGAVFLAAYAPAQASNLAATLEVAQVHAALGVGTDVAKATVVASELA